MRFAREHLFGIIIGIVLAEVYQRSKKGSGASGA